MELDQDICLELLLRNFQEMNSLWIRLNGLIDDKEERKKQRKDLGVTVAENLS